MRRYTSFEKALIQWHTFHPNFPVKDSQNEISGESAQLCASQRACCFWNIHSEITWTAISLRSSILWITAGGWGEREEGEDITAALLECSAVITSTLKDCSSAFTAHKIHSNNWQLSVHAQQLWRHLLPRSVNKTIVKPTVVALCLQTLLVLPFVLLQVWRGRGEILRVQRQHRLGASLAEPKAGERSEGEGAGSPTACRGKEKGFFPRGSPCYWRLSAACRRSPGETSSTPAVVPSGGVQLVFLSARHSSAFSIAFPTDCACAAWLHPPTQPVLIQIRRLLQNTALTGSVPGN